MNLTHRTQGLPSKSMSPRHPLLRFILALGLLGACCLGRAPGQAAPADASARGVLEAGFSLYAKGGADLALDTWRKGGLAEMDSGKLASQNAYLRQAERAMGNYRSYEAVQTKRVGANSQILYLAINYQRGAVYARFLLFRTERDWVVQSMDFSLKPEAVMPWLALESAE
ncbi:MAG: hypothetical protein ABSC03_12260 [Verrucomicrobiota bacterium]